MRWLSKVRDWTIMGVVVATGLVAGVVLTAFSAADRGEGTRPDAADAGRKEPPKAGDAGKKTPPQAGDAGRKAAPKAGDAEKKAGSDAGDAGKKTPPDAGVRRPDARRVREEQPIPRNYLE